MVRNDEARNNPKAKAALEKEWENLRTKGVWDESRVRECKSIVGEARKNGETVHLGRVFEACYEKGSELLADDPRRKFKGRTVFQGNNVRDQDSDHALFADPAQHRWELQNSLMRLVHNLDFQKLRQAYIQALFTGVPAWLSLLRNRWQNIGAKSFGNLWFHWFWHCTVTLTVEVFGKII